MMVNFLLTHLSLVNVYLLTLTANVMKILINVAKGRDMHGLRWRVSKLIFAHADKRPFPV